jgi:hypothetical protein
MTTTLELTEEQQLALDFEKCPTIRGRIEIKRKAMARGYMKLVEDFLRRGFVPPSGLQANQMEYEQK